MLPESGGRRVEVHGKALPEPENARLMRKAAEKKRKTKVSEVAKRVERRKKGNGAICGSLSAKSTPVFCTLISWFRHEETTAWPPAVMICEILQNDVDVVLAAMSARLLISPKRALRRGSPICRDDLTPADVARASVAAWRGLKLGDLEANDRAPEAWREGKRARR